MREKGRDRGEAGKIEAKGGGKDGDRSEERKIGTDERDGGGWEVGRDGGSRRVQKQDVNVSKRNFIS